MAKLTDEAGGMSQSDKFKELARAVEADEDEQHWDERLRKLAKAKVTDEGKRQL